MKLQIKISTKDDKIAYTQLAFSDISLSLEPLLWDTKTGIISQDGRVVVPYGKLRGFLPAVERIENFLIELKWVDNDEEQNAITTEIPVRPSYHFWYY